MRTGHARYPVLYVTDGDAHIAHTASSIEFLSRNGRMSELIVVGIPNTDRMRDFSPTHVNRPRARPAHRSFPQAAAPISFSSSLKRN